VARMGHEEQAGLRSASARATRPGHQGVRRHIQTACARRSSRITVAGLQAPRPLGVGTPRAVNALASPLSVATPAARTSAITGRRSVARAVAGFNFLPGGGGRVTSRQPRRFRVTLQEDLLMLPIMGALAFPAAAGAQSSTASDLGPSEYQK
jgi:hypothetical protein